VQLQLVSKAVLIIVIITIIAGCCAATLHRCLLAMVKDFKTASRCTRYTIYAELVAIEDLFVGPMIWIDPEF